MSGTQYTLDRDQKNPMDLVKEKPCKTCGQVFANTFEFFGKKLWRTRSTLTTNDVCLTCQKVKTSESMKARWQARRGFDRAYEAERLRQGKALFEANEALRIQQAKLSEQAQLKAEAVRIEELAEVPEIKAIRFEEALQPEISRIETSESVSQEVVAVEDPFDSPVIADVDQGAAVETAETYQESEADRLMRELLGK